MDVLKDDEEHHIFYAAKFVCFFTFAAVLVIREWEFKIYDATVAKTSLKIAS